MSVIREVFVTKTFAPQAPNILRKYYMREKRDENILVEITKFVVNIAVEKWAAHVD